MLIPSGQLVVFRGVLAGKDATGYYYGADVEGVIVNASGTTSLLQSAVTARSGNTFTPTVTIAADDTNDALSITVTGASTNACRYWLHIYSAEVG